MPAQEETILVVPRHVGGLVFDAVFEEVHRRELDVMSHPNQLGFSFADHVTLGPFHVHIVAGVSDRPLIQKKDDVFSKNKRSRQAFELLCLLQEKGEPFDVQTGLKYYQNMVCASLQAKQDKLSPNALYFQAKLVQVNHMPFVSLWNTQAGSIYQQTCQLVDLGHQQAEPFRHVGKYFYA